MRTAFNIAASYARFLTGAVVEMYVHGRSGNRVYTIRKMHIARIAHA